MVGDGLAEQPRAELTPVDRERTPWVEPDLPDAPRLTPESLELWEQRTADFVAATTGF